MSQLKVNALVSYSGNTVTLGTSGDTINVASGVTFNTASATVNLPTTIKVSTIQNTNSTNLITQTNVTTITFGATSQTISVPSVASFASTIGVGGATPATSGAGITFPASVSDSSDANTLDDYEEGTWTPSFSSAGSPVYTVQFGRYTKIGRVVYCSVSIRVSSGISSASTITLGGIPFAAAETGDSGQRSCWVLANGGHLSNLSAATGRFRTNGSNMQGVKGNSSTTFMTATEMTSGGSIDITGDFWYYT
jgi:hypothetical protein